MAFTVRGKPSEAAIKAAAHVLVLELQRLALEDAEKGITSGKQEGEGA